MSNEEYSKLLKEYLDLEYGIWLETYDRGNSIDIKIYDGKSNLIDTISVNKKDLRVYQTEYPHDIAFQRLMDLSNNRYSPIIEKKFNSREELSMYMSIKYGIIQV